MTYYPPYQQPQTPLDIRDRGRVNAIGLSGFIIGILSLLFCWVPLCGIAAIPLAGLGLLLGAIGFFVALAGRRSGVGFPVAAVLVSGLALAVSVAQIALVGGATMNAANEAAKRAATRPATQPTTVPAASTP